MDVALGGSLVTEMIPVICRNSDENFAIDTG